MAVLGTGRDQARLDDLAARIGAPERVATLSVDLTADVVAGYDVVLVSTDHDAVDYRLIADNAKLVVDTRNVFARQGLSNDRVVKA